MNDELVKRLRNKGCQICPICREAADAIEELSKQNEQWEEVLKITLDYIPCWVSVTERLPNVDTNKSGYETTTVLVAVQGWKNAKPMVYQRACVRGKTVYRWKWVWDKIYDGPPITHWMPLPKPPKEEI